MPKPPQMPTPAACRLIILLAGGLLLSACGIKGSLYLPEVPPAPAAATGADHNKDDSPRNAAQ